jgi:drug/metabolite transporter (DMT)-like permease
MKKEAKGTLLALAAAVISGFAIPVNKVFVVDIDPLAFTAVRALIIGVIFFLLASRQSDFRRVFRKIPWKYLIAIGIIGGGLAFLLYFTGLKLTTGGRAAFLHKTLPIYVAIFAYIFLKEKLPRKQSLGLLVMLAGAFVLLSSQIDPSSFWTDPSFGDLLVLGGTILWGVENTLARKALLNGEGNLTISFGRMFIGGVFLMALLGAFSNIGILLTLSLHQVTNLLISAGILFAYVLTWYWSIKLINVSKASAILLLAPVISTFLGVLWLAEPLPFYQAAGSCLILAGSVFVLRAKSEFYTGV